MYCERMVEDMTFTKINEYTVQCVITMHELDQMGYELNELYTNKEAATNFMRNVMEKGVEAGFQLNNNLQEIQVSHFSDEQLILNFTEVNPENQVNQIIGGALDAYEAVKTLGKERLENILGMTGQEKLVAFQQLMAEYYGLIDKSKEPELKLPKKEKKKAKFELNDTNQYMFQFSDLSHLRQLCESVNLKVQSRLYEDKKQYYLLTDFDGIEQEKLNGFLLRALEFEGKVEKNKLILAHIKEHANPMIKANAIEELKKIKL